MVLLLTLVTPEETAALLGQRMRTLRLMKGWSRNTLAQRAGVTAASLKRFENSGKVSLESLLKLAHVLGRLDEFGALLTPPIAQSLKELETQVPAFTRKRGRM